ncbi:DUF423 domain-containing protein [bacterium]|nr:DUF423 domain-containing protein [bacterium]
MVRLFACLGAVVVALGAFGSHGLKGTISGVEMDVWRTAVNYGLLHIVLGLIPIDSSARHRARVCWLIGVLLFSGSLFLLVLFHNRMFGVITPIGGLILMVGWATLAVPSLGRKKL